jgi:CP family cyanate transporter-like MFS transporter
VQLALIGLRSATSSVASALSGMVQGLGYTLAIAGPIGIGLLHQATGSWDAPFVVLLALLVVLLVAGWFACLPTTLGDEPSPQPVAAPLAQ